MEMRIRIFAITAALLLLTGSTTFAQQNSGSPYVQLRPLKSEPPLRFGTQKQLLVDNEMLFFYGGTRYAHSKPGPPIVDDGEYLKFTATTPTGKGHLVRRQNRCPSTFEDLPDGPLDGTSGPRDGSGSVGWYSASCG